MQNDALPEWEAPMRTIYSKTYPEGSGPFGPYEEECQSDAE